METVQFELPTHSAAAELWQHLLAGRSTWTEPRLDAWLVFAELGEADDFAVLLRSAEDWLAATHLRAIRFSVDGRCYVLEAGRLEWSHLDAAAA
jgi:hypothetical protein